jgi:cold shock CspA family protein
VTSFDATRGLGTVTDDHGASFGFHATAIADGSRAIDVGTEVIFTVVPGHRGRYEARSIGPAPVPAG